MNLLTSILHLLSSGAGAYVTAHQMRYSLTRPNLLAGFQLAEAGSVPFLSTLSQRAAQEGELELAEKLARHAEDERRHGQIFAQGLKQMGKKVIDFQSRSKKTEDSQPQQSYPSLL